MEKITIVINGVGGCGKDTLIDLLSNVYKVRNKSSITPVKEIAKNCGWEGDKSEKSRKFLSDLKMLLVNFNDLPTKYLLNEQQQFLKSDEQIMFAHIREPEEIEKFKNLSKCKTYAILIKPRKKLQNKVYGNHADDDLENYNYDFVFYNDKPLEVIKEDWIDFITKNIF